MAIRGADIADFEVADGVVAGLDEFLDLERAGCVDVGETQSRRHRVEDGAHEHGREHVGDRSHCFRREGGVK